MIKCVILDDELLAISYLKLLCDQIEEIEVVKAFNNPKIFIQEIENIDCDVCILDIEMPGKNGLQVAEIIKNKKTTCGMGEKVCKLYDNKELIAKI